MNLNLNGPIQPVFTLLDSVAPDLHNAVFFL